MTLGCQLRDLAPGLTPRSVLEKFGAMQMIDVHLPTADGREVVLTRYNPARAGFGTALTPLEVGVATTAATQNHSRRQTKRLISCGADFRNPQP